MSLRATPLPPVPTETARVAHAAFPRGNPYLALRDAFEPLFTDPEFEDLFAPLGRPAEAPWRLALVCLLQFAENLSDRQAADAVRSRLDWKYLLSLELADPGFDASVLCTFRARLLTGGAETRLFDRLLERFRTAKLLKERGTQRTDATRVLAAVRTLNRLELVGETLRHALNALAVVAPAWLLAHAPPEWVARYGRRFEAYRLPQSRPEREALAVTIGADGVTLLRAVYAPETPPAVRTEPAVEILRQVWVQQYTGSEPHFRWRTGEELPPAALLIQSPYDPEAHYSEHGEKNWIGYSEHVTETCDPRTPLLVTDVQTTPAPTPDQVMLPQIHAALARRGLLPKTQLVDAGYLTAAGLVAAQEQYGVTLVGPVQADSSWQAQAGQGFAADHFQVDWEAQAAVCPGGKTSVAWREKVQRGHPVVVVHFAKADCHSCPHREQCTRAANHGRRLTLRPEALYRARQAAREQEGTAAFREVYAARAGIEGSHSQAVRRCGLRRCRYVGWAKTQLQHLLTAAALNLVRVGQWLLDTPRARTRRDAFVRLLTQGGHNVIVPNPI